MNPRSGALPRHFALSAFSPAKSSAGADVSGINRNVYRLPTRRSAARSDLRPRPVVWNVSHRRTASSPR